MRLEVEAQLLQPLALERVHHGVIPGGDVDFERGIDLAQVVQEWQELDRVRGWRARIGPEQARLRVELPARDVDVSARRERRLAKTRVITLRIHQHASALEWGQDVARGSLDQDRRLHESQFLRRIQPLLLPVPIAKSTTIGR
jgi:hypothetical protein